VGHTSFYNSKAFELAKVTKDTPNPPGGTFDRDANGELNGRVTDRRAQRLQRRRASGRRSRRAARQRERDGIAHISKQFARYGLTSVHHEGGDLTAMQEVRARGDSTIA
jgi:predicted amidohydrolase YtcJ